MVLTPFHGFCMALGVAIGEAVHHFGMGLLQKREALRGS